MSTRPLAQNARIYGLGFWNTVQRDVSSFVFSGGELNVRIELDEELKESEDGLAKRLEYVRDLIVFTRLQSSDAIMELVILNELFNRHCPKSMTRRLVVPYFPCGRDDRVMKDNVAFSLDAMAKLINSLGYDKVYTLDPHSHVTAAVVRGLKPVAQHNIVSDFAALTERLRPTEPGFVLVGPDVGESNKVGNLAKIWKCPTLLAAKERDIDTGELSGVVKINGSVRGKRVLIVDDLCDGGRTFVDLAKKLRKSKPESIHLYVTHGIFSRGLSVFKGLIDGIFTTDSFESEAVIAVQHGDTEVPLIVHPVSAVLYKLDNWVFGEVFHAD